jgi:uncharacterized delta-60 repeat protein
MSSTPVLIWTKVLGSSTYNQETNLSTGQDGSIYISGGKINNGSTDAYLIKYTSDGTKAWTKLLGTTGEDYSSAVVTGLDGSIYIAGSAGGALDAQIYAGNTDAFLTKFNADGTKIWTKELGSASTDRATALTVGIDGSIFVAGYTLSALDGQINSGGADVFLTKYKPDGSKIWTKLLGTAGADTALALSTGLDGSIFLSGATTGALDGIKNNGNFDAFLTKFNADGLQSWTKQFGSNAEDVALDIATGLDGSIYICGITLGSFDSQVNSGNYDAFLTKYSANGTKIWTKFVGTSTEDQSYDLTIGIDGSIYMSGYTGGALDGQQFSGLQDGFLIKYNPDGTKIWTKLISTNQEDEAYGITTGIDGTIYVSGYTEGNLNGNVITNADIFLIKFKVTSENAPVIGTSVSETLSTTMGNDSINGGDGIDTVVASAKISNYSVSKTATGYTLLDKNGLDGTDTLVNIEAIKFTDMTINLTVQAEAASAPKADVTRLVELYTAFFNRVPDADGMSFWIQEMKSGKTTNQIAEAFYNAGVNYSSLTGFSSAMTNADFINVIYKNVLGRKDGADTGGLSFWETEITSGRASRGTLVTNILDSAHTFKGNATWGWVADLLDNKITVAKKFSIDMGLNYNTPEESITKGMAIASAITATDTSVAVTLIGVTEANLLLV